MHVSGCFCDSAGVSISYKWWTLLHQFPDYTTALDSFNLAGSHDG